MSKHFDQQAESAARHQRKWIADARRAGGTVVQDSVLFDVAPEKWRELEARIAALAATASRGTRVRVFDGGRPERAKLIALGLLRPKPRQSLKPIHVPAWVPVLRLDAAGAGHAYVRVRRERAQIAKERGL